MKTEATTHTGTLDSLYVESFKTTFQNLNYVSLIELSPPNHWGRIRYALHTTNSNRLEKRLVRFRERFDLVWGQFGESVRSYGKGRGRDK